MMLSPFRPKGVNPLGTASQCGGAVGAGWHHGAGVRGRPNEGPHLLLRLLLCAVCCVALCCVQRVVVVVLRCGGMVRCVRRFGPGLCFSGERRG